jgi:Arylsulfotransferase (ASST)
VSKRVGLLIVGAAVAAALIATAVANTSSGTNVPVAVYPSDEDRAASPVTQISFRGARPASLTGIEVTGAESGRHSGKLMPHSDGLGASFLPDAPFKYGESVTVTADADLMGGGGDNKIEFKTYEEPPAGEAKLAPKIHDPGGTPPGAQRFRSAPGLNPPSLEVTRKDRGVARGHLFLGVKAGAGQDGPMITDDDGKLIWFHRVPPKTSAFDFRAQRYRGRDVLTWWQGPVLAGEGFGDGVIYDDHYRQIATVHAGNGYRADLHEFLITRRNTALLIAYHPIRANLHNIPNGPKKGAALDTVVQEIDIKTGLVMFEWHAFDHVRLHDAFNPYQKHHAFDFAHVNSIYEEENGNLLISVRNASTAVEVDRATGKTVFRIGGKRPTLPMQPNGFFIAQHSINRTKTGAITIFDNGAGAPPKNGRFTGRPSRGLVLRQPKLVPGLPQLPIFVEQSLRPDSPRRTFSQGSVQELDNRDFFVGWGGDQPWISEFSNDGQLVYDAHLVPKSLDTYRAYRLRWTGHPEYPPSIAASGTKVYASWNGATNVHRWQVIGGSNPNDLKPVGPEHDETGFETAIDVSSPPSYVAVRALDKDGKTLGTSKAIRPS